MSLKNWKDNKDFTSQAEKTRTHCCVENLIVYLHVIAFKEFILECACEAIKPVDTLLSEWMGTNKLPIVSLNHLKVSAKCKWILLFFPKKSA